jgi:hypothetical protein
MQLDRTVFNDRDKNANWNGTKMQLDRDKNAIGSDSV